MERTQQTEKPNTWLISFGMNVPEIRLSDQSGSYVRCRIEKREPIPRKGRGKKNKIISLFRSNVSIIEIAEICNCSRSYVNEVLRDARLVNPLESSSLNRRPVIAFDKQGKQARYKNVVEAAVATGCVISSIIRVCRGGAVSTRGYRFEWIEE